jgi:predicted N-acyltransferase
LPFSDHCEPLVEDQSQLEVICRHLASERQKRGWRNIEVRPQLMTPLPASGMTRANEYCLHLLDLRPEQGVDALLRSFHKDSVQRKIHRASREGLTCEEGRGSVLLDALHRFVVATRRRHGRPPPPLEWFRNLAASLGPAMTVRIASRAGQPIAGIVTLRHGKTMVYKYGASDAAFHPTGGMHLLLWRAIQQAREQGCLTFDLGRSDPGQEGLR